MLKMKIFTMQTLCNPHLNAVADPGFPRAGGTNSPGGVPTYEFAKFSQKLHEIERIWTPGGIPRAPLRSAAEMSRQDVTLMQAINQEE